MTRPPFTRLLQKKWQEKKFVCIGLDQPQFSLNKKIIDLTFDLVLAYKPNSAFYEAGGVQGIKSLEKTISYIQKKCPDVAIILDAKRGDIGNTNLGYVKEAFDNLEVDAITVNPYLGKEALEPFLDRKDKGIIILVKTSNPGAGEFQDLKISGKPLYLVVAKQIAEKWNKNNNCCVVVGATYPKELKKVRQIIGDMPILIPGIGTQGGDLQATVKMGQDSNGEGIIISSSRGIIFASDPRVATLKLTNQIKSIISNLSS